MQQDTFISHLIELRDRLLRSVIAVIVVFLGLFHWANDLYTLLARPLLRALPKPRSPCPLVVTCACLIWAKLWTVSKNCGRFHG